MNSLIPTLSGIPTLPAIMRLLRYGAESRRQEEEMARENPHLARALAVEKATGHRIAVIARTVALLVVAVMLPLINPNWDVLIYEALILIFVALGWAQLRVATVGQSRVELALILADIFLLTATMLLPNPFVGEDWPTASGYVFGGFDYFYLLLAAAMLAYSWRTLLAFGSWTALVWLGAMLLIYFFGRTIPELSQRIAEALTGRERLLPFIDPSSVQPARRIQEVVIFVMVAAILALKSSRSNRLLRRQAEIAAERANLSRYFPPSLVDDLARRDEPLGKVRSQAVAVLFADIVGFTSYAESHPPEEVVELLRRFHAILEDCVFANAGTLDKYLGDGIMATFGTPRTGPRDATNALLAARAMFSAIEAWNHERVDSGAPPVRLSLGINYGAVVLGDIGTERRLEFAALGDTVNVASRLEHATRELGCRLVVSQSLVERAAAEEADGDVTGRLVLHRALSIRGRTEPVDVYTG